MVDLRVLCVVRGRNNSKISGSQQDCLVEKSGSPQEYLAVLKMAPNCFLAK